MRAGGGIVGFTLLALLLQILVLSVSAVGSEPIVQVHKGLLDTLYYKSICKYLIGYAAHEVEVVKDSEPVCSIVVGRGERLTGIDVYEGLVYIGLVGGGKYYTIVLNPTNCTYRVSEGYAVVFDDMLDPQCSKLHAVAANGSLLERGPGGWRRIARLALRGRPPYYLVGPGRLAYLAGGVLHDAATGEEIGVNASKARGSVCVELGGVSLCYPRWIGGAWLGLRGLEYVLLYKGRLYDLGLREKSSFWISEVWSVAPLYWDGEMLVLTSPPYLDIGVRVYVYRFVDGGLRLVFNGSYAPLYITDGYILAASPAALMAAEAAVWVWNGSRYVHAVNISYAFLSGLYLSKNYSLLAVKNLSRSGGLECSVYLIDSHGIKRFNLGECGKGFAGFGFCGGRVAVWFPRSTKLLVTDGNRAEVIEAQGFVVGMDSSCNPVVAGRRTIYSPGWVLRLPRDTAGVIGALSLNDTLYLYRVTADGETRLMVVREGRVLREYRVESQRLPWIIHADGSVVNLELVYAAGHYYMLNPRFAVFVAPFVRGRFIEPAVLDGSRRVVMLVATPRGLHVYNLPSQRPMLYLGLYMDKYVRYIAETGGISFEVVDDISKLSKTPLSKLPQPPLASAKGSTPTTTRISLHTTTSSIIATSATRGYNSSTMTHQQVSRNAGTVASSIATHHRAGTVSGKKPGRGVSAAFIAAGVAAAAIIISVYMLSRRRSS